MKVFLFAFALALGCTGDHVVGSTMAPDGAMPEDASGDGSRDANMIDSGTDAGACGGYRQPCCTMGMQCQNGLCCTNGICR
jgi:hypothetical protein